jgi:hypothetical protein
MRSQKSIWRSDGSTRKWAWKIAALTLISFDGLLGMSVSGQMMRAPEGATANICSMPGIAPDSGHSFNDSDLLASYNSQAGLIQTVQGSVVVRAKSGPELGSKLRDSRPSPAILTFRAPASLRMTGVVPFSARRTFDIASDGRDFRLLVPDGKIMRFFVGPVDAPPVSSNPRENLRPQPIVDALHWFPARLVSAAAPGGSGTGDVRALSVVLLGPHEDSQKTARLEFDLRHGTVSKIDIFDDLRKIVTELQYSNWQQVPVSGKPGNSICFPKQVLVNQRAQNLQLEIKTMSVQLNTVLAPTQFQLIPPRGIPVTRITQSTGGSHP